VNKFPRRVTIIKEAASFSSRHPFRRARHLLSLGSFSDLSRASAAAHHHKYMQLGAHRTFFSSSSLFLSAGEFNLQPLTISLGEVTTTRRCAAANYEYEQCDTLTYIGADLLFA
jgi:hypothetical protein